MRLSLTWFFVLIISGFVAYFGRYGWKVYEEFTTNEVTEGFTALTGPIDVVLTSCPFSEVDTNKRMKAIIPKGSTETFCYDGSVKRCSLSSDPSNSESCTRYYLDFLNQKSIQCPSSMSKYFQNTSSQNNVDTSIRGCTSGTRNADGTAPVSSSDPRCYFYSNQKDELEKLDSCTNIKMLESSECFTSAGGELTAQLIAPEGGKGSPWIKCTLVQSSINSKGRAIQRNIMPGVKSC